MFSLKNKNCCGKRLNEEKSKYQSKIKVKSVTKY